MQMGGAERTLFQIMKNLNPKLFELYLAAPQGPFFEFFRPLCREVFFLTPGYFPVRFRPLADLRGFYALARNFYKVRFLMKEVSFDLVFSNTSVILHGLLAAKVFKIPHITMAHEILLPSFFRFFISKMLRVFSARVMVQSNAVAKHLFLDGVFPNLVKIPAGVSLNGDFQNGSREDQIFKDIPSERPLIGLVGLVEPTKGIDRFLKMAVEVLEKIPQALFLVVGKYDSKSFYYRRLLTLRRKLGLDHRLIFTGPIYRIQELLRRLDILVVTSINESLSLVSLEASANGIPVVAFDVGGISEVVHHGVTGCLIPSGDIQSMALTVTSLVQNEKLRKQMGLEGKKWVHNRFNLEDQKGKLEEAFLKILS
jgi:glycosyltransferase involved in cell wall biosynthesis